MQDYQQKVDTREREHGINRVNCMLFVITVKLSAGQKRDRDITKDGTRSSKHHRFAGLLRGEIRIDIPKSIG